MLVSRHFEPNIAFRVNKPVEVWAFVSEPKATSSYYGASRIHRPDIKKTALPAGAIIHWISGGTFYSLPGNVTTAFRCMLNAPKDPFEKSYGGDMSDLWFKQRVDDGSLEDGVTGATEGVRQWKDFYGTPAPKKPIKPLQPGERHTGDFEEAARRLLDALFEAAPDPRASAKARAAEINAGKVPGWTPMDRDGTFVYVAAYEEGFRAGLATKG
jgi:hypothetical protein